VPAVRELLHHLALALAVVALAQAALRMAAAAAPRGLERLIATIVLTVALAIAEALALGVVDLGGNTVALTLAAVATAAAAIALLPRPEVPLLPELYDWWRGLALTQRAGAAALAGFCGAWAVWQLLHFSIGFDSSLYHYPLVAGWIENGTPGSELLLSYEIPYGNYPLTDEVALTWSAAISRSWVPLALWNPLLLLVLAGAGWLTMRNLKVPRVPAGLAIAVVATAPLMVRQLNEPQTDLPALAWLACVAGLSTAAGRRPALLAPALVAAGLAIGTKPSTAPMAVAALAVGAYLARGRLRPLAGWLALGGAGAVVVGGIWYLRNLIDHGSPLWPFESGPWGDPEPRFLGLVNQTFLDRPLETLEGRLDEYVDRLGGSWLLLAGTLAVLAFALLARDRRELRRPLLVTGGLTVLGFLIWSGAWGTGLSTSPELTFAEGFVVSSLRYMLPALAAAALTVALVARAGGLAYRLSVALLSVALGWNLVEVAQLGSPWTPPIGTLALGVLAGLALLAVGTLLTPRIDLRLPGWGVAAATAAVVGALLAAVSGGFLERYTEVSRSTAYGPELVRWFVEQPGFEEDSGRIAIASRGVMAQLAGERFNQRLELVPQWASCDEVKEIARRMPVVVTVPLFFEGTLGVEGYSGARCLADEKPIVDLEPFYVYKLARSPRRN
jgi:hypothetical protein